MKKSNRRVAAKLPSALEQKWIADNLLYNAETGAVWNKKKEEPTRTQGTPKYYYKVRTPWGNHMAHRIAWFLYTGVWPDPNFVVDHHDGIRNNNKWNNLSMVTVTQNLKNKHFFGDSIHVIEVLSKIGITYTVVTKGKRAEKIIIGATAIVFDSYGRYKKLENL